MNRVTKTFLSISCAAMLTAVISGCDKGGSGIVPATVLTEVYGAVRLSNAAGSDPSTNMYKGYLYYQDFDGVYSRTNAFSLVPYSAESIYQLNRSMYSTKATVWFAPEVNSSFDPTKSDSYNPDLTVDIIISAKASNGRSIRKKYTAGHLKGPIAANEITSKYLETFNCRVTVEAVINEEDEPDVIFTSTPAN